MHTVICKIGILVLSFATLASAANRIVSIGGGNPAQSLQLTIPSKAKVTPMKEKTVIQTTEMFLHLWPVPKASTVDQAQSRLADVIKGDVQKFSASATNAITVCGSPARHLVGRGVEADDGDAATADVVIFTAAGQAYVACVHGETDDASREREPMLKMLQTATAATSRTEPGKK